MIMNGNGIGRQVLINGEEKQIHMIQMNTNNIGIHQLNPISGEREVVLHTITMMVNMNTIGMWILNLIRQERKAALLVKLNMNIIGIMILNHINTVKREVVNNLEDTQQLHRVQLHIMNNIGMLILNHINGGKYQMIK